MAENDLFNVSTKTAHSPPNIALCGICNQRSPGSFVKCGQCKKHFHVECAGITKGDKAWTCNGCGHPMTLRSQKKTPPEKPDDREPKKVGALENPQKPEERQETEAGAVNKPDNIEPLKNTSQADTPDSDVMKMLTLMMAKLESRDNDIDCLMAKVLNLEQQVAQNAEKEKVQIEDETEIFEIGGEEESAAAIRMPYNSTSVTFANVRNQQGSFESTQQSASQARNTSDQNTSDQNTTSSYSFFGASMRNEQLMLPKFSGDPGEWPLFLSVYERTTKQYSISDDENNIRLQKSLTGEARQMVSSCLMFPNMTEAVMSTLKLLYGNPRKLIESMVSEVQRLPAVTEKMDYLLLLTTKVQQLYHLITSCELPQHLSNPSLIQNVERKLPNALCVAWTKYREEKKSETLGTLHEFLAEQARILGSLDSLSVRKMTSAQKSSRGEHVHVHSYPISDRDDRRSKKRLENCILKCKTSHKLEKCQAFLKMNAKKRYETVKTNHICWNCLTDHYPKRCVSQTRCQVGGCQFKHNPLMHEALKRMNDGARQPAIEEAEDQSEQAGSSTENEIVNTTNTIKEKKTLLFKILPVILQSEKKTVKTYAFLDEGSTVTMLDDKLAKELGLKGPKSPLNIKWTGDTTKSEKDSEKVSLKIRGVAENSTKFVLTNVRTTKDLDLPIQSLTYHKEKIPYTHLRNLPIKAYEKVQPKILIGLEHIQLGTALEIKEGKLGEPVGVRTRLGWTLYGSYPNAISQRDTEIVNFVQHNDNLHELVKGYFSTENFGVNFSGPQKMSDEDERALEILRKTTKFTGERYSTGLLWREQDPVLPNNREMAEKRLNLLNQKMKKDDNLNNLTHKLFEDYISKGYLRKLDENESQIKTGKTWYLPYFFVTNPNKPNKIRMVWDAAATYRNTSLNSALLKGPDLINPLPAVLQRFREKRIAVTADIKEMFHQIAVNEEDQQAQRVLWRSENGNIQEFVMQVMTFGATCSPSIAQYIKNRNASEHGIGQERAQTAIKEDHYVDDWLGCFDEEDEAIEVAQQVSSVHQKGGFTLAKWSSNSEKFMTAIGEKTAVERDIQTVEQNVQVLGMLWDPVSDHFRFRISDDLKNSLVGVITKRQVLSLLMKIYDPLGLISFFHVQSKLLLRDIWRTAINWDDPITENLYQMWTRWVQWLPNIEKLRIARYYGNSDIDPELHILVDASEKAFAAVAYMRRKVNGQYMCSLIGSKTRVAPMRAMSVPRLELQAAVLGVRLSKLIVKQQRMRFSATYYWTDSQTVLSWLHSETRRYRQFVAFRVGEVLESTNVNQWKYVPSKMNVADDATKWSLKDEICQSQRWFTGPEFLCLAQSEWPEQPEIVLQGLIEEEIVERVCKSSEFVPIVPDPERFSSFRKLVRSTAWALRFFRATKAAIKDDFLGKEEISLAENEVYRQAQKEVYGNEIMRLRNHEELPKSSKLICLNPFLDDNGILRLGGRINNAKVKFEVKNPIILPKTKITTLLVASYHEKLYHANHATVINNLRQKFFISRLRALIKRVRSGCQGCKIRDAVPVNPQMGELPTSRLASFTVPFSYVGIDYFGPQLVSVGRRVEKRWGVLFTCLTTRAIHLEIAHTLSSNSCLMVIRNFINRRGMPIEIRTDNGTNFKGSESILKKCGVIDIAQLHEEFPAVKWKFNPPGAPHMGGCWERLIQSVKKTLKVVSKCVQPNDEVLKSYYCEVEGVINSRPLTHIPLDDDESEAITPNHFLLGSSGGIKPFTSFKTDEVVLRNTWERAQQMAQHFWNRWLKEYLPDLCRRTKWFKKVEPIKVGDVVILHEDSQPNSWIRGIVEKVVIGRRDDQVRQAYVRTMRGTLFRPASKIAVLSIVNSRKSADS